MADLHQVIVDDDGEVIGGEPVRLQHLIVEAGQVERDLPAQRVGNRYRSFARGLHADHVRSPGVDPLPRRSGRLLAVRLVRGGFIRVLAFAPGGQLLGGW